MLRDKNLIPLSHQHQHALALCVRIDRARPIPQADIPAWQNEISRLYEQEMEVHFSAEESILFPVARGHAGLSPLIEELLGEHTSLRKLVLEAQAGQMSALSLCAFAQSLSAHIRKEERQLFEEMQQMMTAHDLSMLGRRLETALQDAQQSCAVQNQTTRLQPKR